MGKADDFPRALSKGQPAPCTVVGEGGSWREGMPYAESQES
jgi:hypothetical protein